MGLRAAVLVLVAAALLAGWSGATPLSSQSTTASGAPPLPAATTTGDSAEELPPGVNETGIEDASELVEAHEAALVETGFAFGFEANVTVGPARQFTAVSGRVESGLSPLVVESASERDLGDGPTAVGTDLWANETTVAVQYDREGRDQLRRYNRSGGEFGVPDETWAHLPRADLKSQVTNAWLIELALAAGEYDLERVDDRDGERVAVLRATEAAAAANLTDLDSTVVVDEEGRVRELSLTAAYEGEEPTTEVRYEFELTEVGGVSVERPAWVAEAEPPGEANETTATPGGGTPVPSRATATPSGD
ncbi:hypothetical protein NGM10_05235 [Halorussus salilacus]|uniref:DUF7537 family lipoprotein n=1 Tax=Halorussus salilacus TaxID=2953750 RepID=UPI0020A1295C|nr:hypothetical protein [Halorussus salilacus]USZ69142.1 hypothetical protein NGM10_05235 [Halorussus salilacus]